MSFRDNTLVIVKLIRDKLVIVSFLKTIMAIFPLKAKKKKVKLSVRGSLVFFKKKSTVKLWSYLLEGKK